jgi:hypothetical protein
LAIHRGNFLDLYSKCCLDTFIWNHFNIVSLEFLCFVYEFITSSRPYANRIGDFTSHASNEASDLGFLIFLIIHLMRSGHSTTRIIMISIFLVFWLSINAYIYPSFCSEPLLWSMIRWCLASPFHDIRRCLQGINRIFYLSCRCLHARQLRCWSSGDGDQHTLLQHSVHHDLSMLPCEGPTILIVGRRAWAVSTVDIPTYEQRDDDMVGCVVCLDEVRDDGARE